MLFDGLVYERVYPAIFRLLIGHLHNRGINPLLHFELSSRLIVRRDKVIVSFGTGLRLRFEFQG